MLLKKFTAITLICAVFAGSAAFTSYAEEPAEAETEAVETDAFTEEDFRLFKEYEIIDEDTYSPDAAVTRIACLKGVLKAAGMRVDGFYDNITISVEWHFQEFDGFEGFEYAHFGYGCDITNGIRFSEYTDGYFGLYFLPYRIATVEECVAFIMRCIENVPEGTSLDEIYQMAKDRGVIKETDEFFENGEDPLNEEIFCTLLMRMLSQKRYIYFTSEFENRPWSYNGKQIDEEGEMTYLEYNKILCESPEECAETEDGEESEALESAYK